MKQVNMSIRPGHYARQCFCLLNASSGQSRVYKCASCRANAYCYAVRVAALGFSIGSTRGSVKAAVSREVARHGEGRGRT
jgi:hypothetical protein